MTTCLTLYNNTAKQNKSQKGARILDKNKFRARNHDQNIIS